MAAQETWASVQKLADVPAPEPTPEQIRDDEVNRNLVAVVRYEDAPADANQPGSE